MERLSLYRVSESAAGIGQGSPKIPILVRSETMEIEFVATEFLRHISVIKGTTRSPKTWRAYAYVIKSFCDFALEKSGGYTELSQELLVGYRMLLEERGLVKGTLARSLAIVCCFYEWGAARGHLTYGDRELRSLSVENHGLLRHLQGRFLLDKDIVMPRVPRRRRYPRYYTREEQALIYDRLCERDKLIMDWALYTGARQFEIAALTMDQLPPPSEFRTRDVYQLTLRVAKNGIKADLWVPSWLLRKTIQYTRFFGRRETVAAAKARGAVSASNVFLSRWGAPLRPDSIYRTFRNALRAAGLSGTFHALRHTYAISMLHKLMQLPENANSDGTKALLQLKHLMRHSSVATTCVYLEARNFYLTAIYADLFELPDTLRSDA